ncbi:MAG: hypothetical protein RLZZ408_1197 [Verrucomicrobiota bacterium]
MPLPSRGAAAPLLRAATESQSSVHPPRSLVRPFRDCPGSCGTGYAVPPGTRRSASGDASGSLLWRASPRLLPEAWFAGCDTFPTARRCGVACLGETGAGFDSLALPRPLPRPSFLLRTASQTSPCFQALDDREARCRVCLRQIYPISPRSYVLPSTRAFKTKPVGTGAEKSA